MFNDALIMAESGQNVTKIINKISFNLAENKNQSFHLNLKLKIILIDLFKLVQISPDTAIQGVSYILWESFCV